MGTLQQLLTQIFQRLGDINTSQRVAIALGGALVGLSLFWLLSWASTPQLVPLLDQSLSPDELAQMRTALQQMGESFEVRSGRLYVSPTANRAAVLARLQEDGKLPGNTSVGLAALIKESDPWLSQEENNRRWTWALQTELQRILSQFQGVREAYVVLNYNTQSRGFSRTAPPGSASVTLVMKGGEAVPRPLALAAARLVAGAVAGLPLRNVQVLDAGGRSALDWDIEHDPASALKLVRAQEEQRFTELIRRQVPDPKALVSVRVELNSTAMTTETSTPSKGVERSSETTTESKARVRSAEQPGVQPNTALAVGGGRGDDNESRETSRTEYATGLSHRTESRPAGDIDTVAAAISLSTSYLEAVYRRANPNADAPDEAAIEKTFQSEKTRLAAQLARLVKPPTEENVAISRYVDTAAADVQSSSAATAGALDRSLDLAWRYGPQSGLALLALVSLGLMMRLARRTEVGESFGLELGLPKEAIEAAKVAAQDVASVGRKLAAQRAATATQARASAGADAIPTVGSGQVIDSTIAEVVGPVAQATATEGVLVAQEVDAKAVQSRKMLDQIASLVDTDSQVIATLLEQWVQRHETFHDRL